MKNIRIFLASPSDVSNERQIVSEAIEDLQLTIGKTRNIHLELIKWETHSYPDIGDYSQDVINNQIGSYSVLVGIMWQRFGTKTKNAGSGTEEEFDIAYKVFKKYGAPKIMFYFKASRAVRNKEELKQLGAIFDFKEKLQNNGALYWDFDSVRDFERKLRVHLYHHIESILDDSQETKSTQEVNTEAGRIFLSHRSVDQDRVGKVYKKMIESGLNPWMAEFDILPGQSWKSEIESAIKTSDIFITFLSKNSEIKSETDFSVDSEWSIAESINEFLGEDDDSSTTSSEIHIFPVLLDEVELPDSVSQLQYYNLIELEELDQFVETIRQVQNKRKANKMGRSKEVLK